MALLARPHTGQDCLGHGNQPEDVGLEEGADFVVFTLLDGGEITVTGIVDQHVDATELVFRRLNGAIDSALVVDIERQGESILLMPGNDISQLFRVARGDDCAPTAIKNLRSDLATKTSGTAGD